MKTIVNVKFKTLLNEKELETTSSADIALLAEVSGLISKTFYVNPKTGYLGAVYQFEDEEAADLYLDTPFFRNMRSRYQVVDDTLSIDKVHITFLLKGLNTTVNNQVVSMKWDEITTKGVLEKVLVKSFQKPVILFKYSNQCPISRSVLRKFDDQRKKDGSTDLSFYLLDVVAHRDLSVKLSEHVKVAHASPQLLLIRDGVCIWYENSTAIDYDEVTGKVLPIYEKT